MDEELRAYDAGRADGLAARRDNTRAADPRTGPDYRMGFLDARLELFRMHTQLRGIVDEPS